jgi:hypothetical protein
MNKLEEVEEKKKEKRAETEERKKGVKQYKVGITEGGMGVL